MSSHRRPGPGDQASFGLLGPRTGRKPRSAGRLALLGLGLLFAACVGTGPSPDPERERYDPNPTWQSDPLSWEKLDAIEMWLARSGRHANPELVVEAELELAEGRLRYARRDRERLTAAALDDRLNAAEAGFRRASENPAASSLQLDRARRGLRDAKDFDRVEAPASPGRILPRGAWRAAAPVHARLTPIDRPYNRITVHHSALRAADLSPSEVIARLQQLQQNHMQGEGYGDIGYHFLIDPGGRVYQGRELRWQGAHSGGANNRGNIGICLLGNFDVERPSPQALVSLDTLLARLSELYGVPTTRIQGHGELKNTACPGTHLRRWLASR